MPAKIFYSSDLHLDHEDPEIDSSPFYMYSDPNMVNVYANSYLVLAGNICQINEKEKFKKFFDIITKKFKAIIYVTGNHEYNRNVYGDILINQGIYCYGNLYFLQNEFIEFPEDEIRFYGVTLWTQLDPNTENNKIAENTGSDFKSIYNHNPLEQSFYITRNGTAKLFEKQFTNLKFDLLHKSKLKTIIVTHHVPLIDIIEPWIQLNEKKFRPLTYLYASDLKSELKNLDFDYWFFGHVHSSYYHELTLNNNIIAKFISNPYGYFGSNNKFNPNYSIEI